MPRMINPPPEKTKEEKAAAFKAWYEKNKARVALKNQARGDEKKKTTWTCECGKTLKGTSGRAGHYETALHKKNMVKKASGIEPKHEPKPEPKIKKVVKEKKVRVLLTEEQKKERMKASHKKYYEKVCAEKGIKKRVKYANETEEEKATRKATRRRVTNLLAYLRRKEHKEKQ